MEEPDILEYLLNVAHGSILAAAKRARTHDELIRVWKFNSLLPEEDWREIRQRVEDALISKATDDRLSWEEKFALVSQADELDLDVVSDTISSVLVENACVDPLGFSAALMREIENGRNKDVAYEIMQQLEINEQPEDY